MKAIQVQLEIKRVTMNKDDSVSFSAATPTLTDEQLSAFRKVSKVLVNALLEPEEGSSDILKIEEKIDGGKTPGQRLRACIFVWWEQSDRPGDFETWYRMKIEKIIETIKGKLE